MAEQPKAQGARAYATACPQPGRKPTLGRWTAIRVLTHLGNRVCIPATETFDLSGGPLSNVIQKITCPP